MRITIIAGHGENSVGVDGVSRNGLDLSSCGLPSDFWAFQWGEDGSESGHVEYKSPLTQNQEVTEKPAWVLACMAKLQEKLDQEEAEAAAAAAAANESSTSV